jgi:hypothetical protein
VSEIKVYGIWVDLGGGKGGWLHSTSGSYHQSLAKGLMVHILEDMVKLQQHNVRNYRVAVIGDNGFPEEEADAATA